MCMDAYHEDGIFYGRRPGSILEYGGNIISKVLEAIRRGSTLTELAPRLVDLHPDLHPYRPSCPRTTPQEPSGKDHYGGNSTKVFSTALTFVQPRGGPNKQEDSKAWWPTQIFSALWNMPTLFSSFATVRLCL